MVSNKRVIESLIKAGTLTRSASARQGLVFVIGQAVDAVIDIKRNGPSAHFSLFGGASGARRVSTYRAARRWATSC